MSRSKPTIGIIGLGLIGGSIALRLKQQGLAVVGWDTDAATVQLANSLGIGMSSSIVDCLQQSDLVFLCLPIESTIHLLNHWPVSNPLLVTDVCSTKESIVLASKQLPKSTIFIPGHPMAGKEVSGLANADPDLFLNKTWVLTPLPHTPAIHISSIAKLIKLIGANIIVTSPIQHDHAASQISHLPHLLSAAFISTISDKQSWNLCQKIAGSGFKDFSRLAEDNPSMHSQICRHNAANILSDITNFERRLQIFKTALTSNDLVKLEQLFISAQTARAKWRKQHVS